CFAAFSWNDYW
nr:immunoglobulin heavy chain junction region [Macaca mulatta]MOW24057.1 immunoglobulin heavy chain junction region [Macaca mulatta]MOW25071.1 immunoglobulin heavy chain junction region [Macaca mulatta]MOW25564.1 immunoglobulin heavy chain junction region [Macaca mulatta]MOW25820.1 immunoglobulin heavy chain junction region [Macaca mulatta]